MLVNCYSNQVFQIQPESSELDKYRAEFHLEKKRLTRMLRKTDSDPEKREANCGAVRFCVHSLCVQTV